MINIVSSLTFCTRPLDLYNYNRVELTRLTCKIKIDRGRDLTSPIFRPDFVETCITFDHIVQFQDDCEFLRIDRLNSEFGSIILLQQLIAAIPFDVRLCRRQQLTLENQSIAIVLLTKLRFLNKTGSKVFGHAHFSLPPKCCRRMLSSFCSLAASVSPPTLSSWLFVREKSFSSLVFL